MISRVLIIAVLMISFAAVCEARTVGTVNIAENRSFAGKNLTLNGTYLRTKFMFKVYALGLYVEQKTNDPDALLNSDKPIVVYQHFIYDGISKKKILDAWDEGFNKILNGNLSGFEPRIAKFKAVFNADLKAGDNYTFAYIPGKGTSVLINGKEAVVIEGADFKKALFSFWISKKQPIAELRAQLMEGK